ncbi:hypothetical protein DID88_004005 [Monilinia fructigena]|uniref:Uncharacterized protein n=1 Tax=Monilinia fructigena TaxID=38457 RepID=A0A395IEB8_9HELO|nr:hypothetical protein DID88_004005 [Monilinia fructigena]
MRLQGPGKDHRPPGRMDSSDTRHPEPPARSGPPQTLCYGLGSLLYTRRRASLFERTGSHHGYDGCPRSVRCAAETPATRPDEDPRVAADPPQAHRLLPHQQNWLGSVWRIPLRQATASLAALHRDPPLACPLHALPSGAPIAGL